MIPLHISEHMFTNPHFVLPEIGKHTSIIDYDQQLSKAFEKIWIIFLQLLKQEKKHSLQ